MATADEYAAWIVKNADQKGTPNFDIVAKAYQAARAGETPKQTTSDDIPLAPGAAERMAAEEARRVPEAPDSLFGKIAAPFEAAASIGTGMIGGLAGAIRGGPLAIPFSDAKDAKALEEEGGKLAESMTYQPRSQAGRHMVEAVGKGLVDSGIIGIPIPELNVLGRAAAPAAGVAGNAVRAGAGLVDDAIAAAPENAVAASSKLRDLVTQRRATMAGVGAAETDAAKMRVQTAANLPIPQKITKSMATRNFADVQFEREKAKMGVEGAPLRARFDELNKGVEQNIDAFIDETGAVAPNDRTSGTLIVKAAEDRRDALKANFDAEYAAARAAGEMAEPINIRPLMQYLEDNRTSAEVAPILNSIEKSLGKKAAQVPAELGGEGVVKIDPLNKTISLNDLEKVRQQIYAEIEHGTPGEVKGLAMRDLIDRATEGKGGPLYQQARRSFENYANEFKGRGVISKLLGTKPGTKDRAVAFEDVLDHLTGQGASLDDVRWVRRTLQASGDDGIQAWKEVQGGLLRKIKREVYSNISNDEAGVANASPAKLNKSIENLDLDGKLDFIYGKQGAQRLRDLNEHSKTILTVPPGSVNYSNTSSALLAALAADFSLPAATGVPAPIATALTFGVKGVKSKLLKRKIQSHLDYEPTPLEVRVNVARQAQAERAALAAANAQTRSNLAARVAEARQKKAEGIANSGSVAEAVRAFSEPSRLDE